VFSSQTLDVSYAIISSSVRPGSRVARLNHPNILHVIESVQAYSTWNDIELLLTPVKSDTFGEDQLGVNERGINCTVFSMQTIKKN